MLGVRRHEMRLSQMTTVLIIFIAITVIVVFAKIYYKSPPCVRFWRSHTSELEVFSLQSTESGTNRIGGKDFNIPDWLEKSGVNHIETSSDTIVYTFYRSYTFPDGPMDNLLYSKSEISSDGIPPLPNIRKPIDKISQLSPHWYYVETE
jgi:hypothetical protein